MDAVVNEMEDPKQPVNVEVPGPAQRIEMASLVWPNEAEHLMQSTPSQAYGTKEPLIENTRSKLQSYEYIDLFMVAKSVPLRTTFYVRSSETLYVKILPVEEKAQLEVSLYISGKLINKYQLQDKDCPLFISISPP